MQNIIIYTFLLLVAVATLSDALPLTPCVPKSWHSASNEMEERLDSRRNESNLTGQAVGSDRTYNHITDTAVRTHLRHTHSHPAHSLCAWTYDVVVDNLRFPKVTVEARLVPGHSTCSNGTSRKCQQVLHPSPFLVPVDRDTTQPEKACIYELRNLPITVGWVCAETN